MARKIVDNPETKNRHSVRTDLIKLDVMPALMQARNFQSQRRLTIPIVSESDLSFEMEIVHRYKKS